MPQAALLPVKPSRPAITASPGRQALPSAPAGFPGSAKRPNPAHNATLDMRMAPYALWVLRLATGAVFLQHVLRMVFGYEPADSSQLFALPPGVSPIAVAWEGAIGLALVYGLWPRLAAIAGAVTLTMAAIFASRGSAALSQYGWQNPVFWTAALLALVLAGDGAFTLVPSRFRVGRTGLRRP